MTETEHHDVIVIGAGVSGIYQIKKLTDLGFDAVVLEADDDLGGTWYRNRYPGCRFDSESYTYGYSFSRELLDEWHWKERFSSQPENLRYLNHVVDRFGLGRHMRFDTRVEQLRWSAGDGHWELSTSAGGFTARFVVLALGPISAPITPPFDGAERFAGQSFHTDAWPKDGVELAGKRVGIIGTGATGIQVIAANLGEIFLDEAANAEMSAYIADRIRRRVDDPATAEKLIPTDHGFGLQRLPLETNYFEAYNHPWVRLVDVSETAIERVTPAGLVTGGDEHELDVLVYATGFDVITGSYDRIDIRGVDGLSLRDKWSEVTRTYFGLLTAGFPNLLMVAGPQSVSGSTNFPRAIETGVDWVTDLLSFVRDEQIGVLDAEPDVEEEWLDEVIAAHERLLFRRSKGWFTGYNPNLGRGEGTVRYHAYFGGAPRYRKRVTALAETGYPGLRRG